MNRSDRAPGSVFLTGMRGAIGGGLMGLANLVPGISGGTMLLAAGVYPAFISAIAELTTLRFRARSMILLGAVAASAALAILLLAGTVKGLVVEHRWIMYSLFIGLTLGGVPLVLRMARPLSTSVAAGGLFGFALMLLMALTRDVAGGSGGGGTLLIFFSGLAAASAMILPGVSGGYLLLILGQYESILGTVDQLKRGLLGDGSSGADLNLIVDAMYVVVPLGLGIVAGVVGVSNLLQWLLRRFEKATLGALLGLLLGAVVGLWPFQEPRMPTAGERIEGTLVTADNVAEIDRDDWPLVSFEPSTRQFSVAAGLIVVGFGLTSLIGQLGRERS